MVHDHPFLPLVHEREAVARRESFGFSVFDIREGVVARIDCGGAIHTDQLLTECHLEIGQHLERRNEIVAQRRSIRSYGWEERSPEDCIGGIARNTLAKSS